MSNTTLTAALQYVSRGWRVIPLHNVKADGSCSCGKADCNSKGKHPRISSWQRHATIDKEQINRWFIQWPDANIGIVGGPESGLAILDIDPRHFGDESLQALEYEHGTLPVTATVSSGGGGLHFYFRYPKTKIGNRANVYPGIDFKADNGYVVAPPSNHASGNCYAWSGEIGEVAVMPDWLVNILTEKPPASASGSMNFGDIPEGGRNNTLFKMACLLRRIGMESDTILSVLLSHNQAKCNPPLGEEEVAGIAESACRYEPEPESALYTDVTNAQWMVREFGDNLRYCTAWNKWLVWDGRRFKVDDTLEIDRMAKETPRRMRVLAETIRDSREKEKLFAHSLRAESQNRLKAMVELAKSEPGIAVLPHELDRDAWLLNCENGTLDLRTGELKPHDRSHLLTKLAPVEYGGMAECPQWQAFLNKIMDDRADLVSFLQLAAGYSLTASTREQCMYFLYGVGANGKSTFLNTLAAMLGDYAGQTPTNTLMAKKNEGIPNDIARLKGLRFVQAAEAEMGKALAESLVKQMTGGDTLTGRFLHGEFFEFAPQFKLFLATNHKPVIRGTDDGIWRRIRLIPFEVTIPEADRDRDLPEKLKSELPGILRWAVEGCLAWQRDGMTLPTAVTAATAEYRSEMDTLAAFIGDECCVGPEQRIGSTELYQTYSEWCETMNERPLRQNLFGMRIKEQGYESRRSGANGSAVWYGIGSKRLTL